MSTSKAKYVGVDGCKGGWLSIALDDGGGYEAKLFKKFSELVDYYLEARLILVDMPIGLPEEGPLSFRDCDKKARDILGKHMSRVFRVASRRLIDMVRQNESWVYSDVNRCAKSVWNGKGVGAQEFGIVSKTAEIDEVMTRQDRPRNVREAHPEVCFWALNGALGTNQPMIHGKHDGLGFLERFRALRCIVPKTEEICNEVRSNYPQSKVGADDILDALVAAVTAKLSCQDRYKLKTLPECLPKDSKGLTMEMVYVEAAPSAP